MLLTKLLMKMMGKVMTNRLSHLQLTMVLAIGLMAFVLTLLYKSPISTQAAGGDISRTQDPVVISGTHLAAFHNVPLNELHLYAYMQEQWQPIPFQIDEVTAAGVYTTTEDGLLDDNDELVFMAQDVGHMVTATNWITDTDARSYPRYALTVTDPLVTGTVGYVYLYRSTTLTNSAATYLTWDSMAQRMTAVSYTLALDTATFLGLAEFTLPPHPADLLDRQKIRVAVNNPFPLPDVVLTEEDAVDLLEIPTTITLPVVGPIRAVGGNASSRFAFYGNRVQIQLDIPISQVEIPIPGATIDSVRVSLDLNNPTTTGFTPTTYYDSNTPAGVSVDGINDAVSTTPPVDWYQVAGQTGGMVVVQTLETADTVSHYYKDDSTVDPDDTGDGQSFADVGVFIEKSGSTLGDLSLSQTIYVLPPGTGNIGQETQTQLNTPLVATSQSQTFTSSEEKIYIYVPLMIKELP